MILSVTSHGVRTVDKSNAPRHERGALLFSGYRLFAQRLSVGVAAGRKTGEHLLGERMQ